MVFFSPEEGKRKVLQIKLSQVVIVGAVEGTSVTIHFSSSLDILQAARKVYGHSKNKVGHDLFTQTSSATVFAGIFCFKHFETKAFLLLLLSESKVCS